MAHFQGIENINYPDRVCWEVDDNNAMGIQAPVWINSTALHTMVKLGRKERPDSNEISSTQISEHYPATPFFIFHIIVLL